jgi:hypothetical protein
MNLSKTSNPENLSEAKLPRRDWIMLPLLSLLTIVSMIAVSEVGSRRIWPERAFDSCLVHGNYVDEHFQSVSDHLKT